MSKTDPMWVFENYGAAAELIDELEAELAEVKGREAVLWCDPSNHTRTCTAEQKATATGAAASALAPLTMALYASPPASPDVEGLVKALEDISRSETLVGDVARSALSTWRQSHP